MIAKEDQELVALATALLDKRYNKPVHTVAAALRATSGQIYTAVNIDHFSGFVCAEMSALDKAINHGEYSFDKIVAVRKDTDIIDVVNMCGKCRQIFHDYNPNIEVIVHKGDQLEVKTIEELLPFSFVRQQHKIQAVIGNGSEA